MGAETHPYRETGSNENVILIVECEIQSFVARRPKLVFALAILFDGDGRDIATYLVLAKLNSLVREVKFHGPPNFKFLSSDGEA